MHRPQSEAAAILCRDSAPSLADLRDGGSLYGNGGDGADSDAWSLLNTLAVRRALVPETDLFMKEKRQIVRAERQMCSKARASLSRLTAWRYAAVLALRGFGRLLLCGVRRLKLWSRPVLRVSSRYGSGVGSYFRLLRSALWVNFVLAALLVRFFLPSARGVANPVASTVSCSWRSLSCPLCSLLIQTLVHFRPESALFFLTTAFAYSLNL